MAGDPLFILVVLSMAAVAVILIIGIGGLAVVVSLTASTQTS